MKLIISVLTFVLILLQIRLWTGDASIGKIYVLKKEVALQEEKIIKLKERNQTLEAEVQDLKHHLSALEERARTDLGMIRQGESFYQFSMKDE